MLKTTEDVLYTFPQAPSEGAMEWDGTPIGKSDTVTRTKSRTKTHDKTIDASPGRREALMDSVTKCLAGRGPDQQMFMEDVIIHGLRVRATTNSKHLVEFWRENWYSPKEWETMTDQPPPRGIAVRVYALGGVDEQPEAAYYSHLTNTIIFFNTAYYGQLKSWVLGAVGRVLASEYGIHSIHGACVEKDKKGILYIAPTGTGKSTSSYGLMSFPNARFHSDDWVYIRYFYQTKDGTLLAPLSVTPEKGEPVRGFQCFRWLEEHKGARAEVRGWGIRNEPYTVQASDLDLSRPPEAYAYLSEKLFYLRCNLVENFPESAAQILHSNLENVPDLPPAFLEKHRRAIERNYQTIMESANPQVREMSKRFSREEIMEQLARLSAFDNARAMLDLTKLFDGSRIFANPMEPVRLTTVMLLKRNPAEDLVLEGLSLDLFMERLMLGETPMGTREIAYNGYRAVDDNREAGFVKTLEALAKDTKRPLYQIYKDRPDIPETLYEEFELFRVMYQATSCYALNTILAKDPKIQGLREAVEATMKVIARCLDAPSRDARLTLETYQSFIK